MTRVRQLWISGLPWVRLQATTNSRDLSARQFALALKRNGFRPLAGGFMFADTTGQVAIPFEAAYLTGPVRIRRRATLAKIIQDRADAAKSQSRTQQLPNVDDCGGNQASEDGPQNDKYLVPG